MKRKRNQIQRLLYSSTFSGIGWLFWVSSVAGQVQAPVQMQGLGANAGGLFQGSTDAFGGTAGSTGLSTLTLGLPALGTTGTATGSGGQLGSGQGYNQAALGSANNLGRSGVGTGSFFYPYYGNPLYEGWPGNLGKGPGGWAVPLYQVSALGTTGSSFSGLPGLAGSALGYTGNVRRPAYLAQVAFPVRRVSSGQVQTDLRDIIARSSALSQPADIEVNMDGQAVVLKGEVVDDRERRVVEGMIRLTPGVHEVRNQLKVKEVLPPPRRVGE